MSRTRRAQAAVVGSGVPAPPRPPGVFARRGDPSLRGRSRTSAAPAARLPRQPPARGAGSPGLSGLSVLKSRFAAEPESLPAPSRSCGGSGSRGRARRRRRRGEGGRALPCGRDWSAACSQGGGGGGSEPGPGASPAETQSVCAVAGTRRLWDPREGSSAGSQRASLSFALLSSFSPPSVPQRPHPSLP